MSNYIVDTGTLNDNEVPASFTVTSSTELAPPSTFVFEDTVVPSLFITTSVTYLLWDTLTNLDIWNTFTKKWEDT